MRTVSDKPISLIINTHTHPDHTGSNEFFGPTVDVVAQENTKMYMQNMDAFKGAGARFLPKRTFKDTMNDWQREGRDRSLLLRRAHTGGDAWVLFKHAARRARGRRVRWGRACRSWTPATAASVVDMTAMAKASREALKDCDSIITGHSTLMKPADLKEYADFNNDLVVVGAIRNERRARAPTRRPASTRFPRATGYGRPAIPLAASKDA
mgnify:CR=1 FL=1